MPSVLIGLIHEISVTLRGTSEFPSLGATDPILIPESQAFEQQELVVPLEGCSSVEAEPRECVQVRRRCRGRAEMITLPREEAEMDVFGTGLCAFYCWEGCGGGGWAGNKGHFTPRTVPAAAPSAIPARKATPGAANPRQDSRDIFQ